MRRAVALAVTLFVGGACVPVPPEVDLPPTTPEREANAGPLSWGERGWEGTARAMGGESETAPGGIPFARARISLTAQLAERGIEDSALLDALSAVPRHLFLPEDVWPLAYQDQPILARRRLPRAGALRPGRHDRARPHPPG